MAEREDTILEEIGQCAKAVVEAAKARMDRDAVAVQEGRYSGSRLELRKPTSHQSKQEEVITLTQGSTNPTDPKPIHIQSTLAAPSLGGRLVGAYSLNIDPGILVLSDEEAGLNTSDNREVYGSTEAVTALVLAILGWEKIG